VAGAIRFGEQAASGRYALQGRLARPRYQGGNTSSRIAPKDQSLEHPVPWEKGGRMRAKRNEDASKRT
jgi:hypothetical protein